MILSAHPLERIGHTVQFCAIIYRRLFTTMQPLPIYHHLYAGNRSSVLLGDCLHIHAGQIVGDYVLHVAFVPSFTPDFHRCGLFVVVEPAGAVLRSSDQLNLGALNPALAVAGSIFDYLN